MVAPVIGLDRLRAVALRRVEVAKPTAVRIDEIEPVAGHVAASAHRAAANRCYASQDLGDDIGELVQEEVLEELPREDRHHGLENRLLYHVLIGGHRPRRTGRVQRWHRVCHRVIAPLLCLSLYRTGYQIGIAGSQEDHNPNRE